MWVGKTLEDHLVVLLGLHGPASIHRLVNELIDQGDWRRIYKRYNPAYRRPPELLYQSIYPRLERLRYQRRVVRDGRKVADHGRHQYRLPTRAEVEKWRAEERDALAVPGELRAHIEAVAARVGFTVAFELDAAVPQGWLILTTPRGAAEIEGPPDQTWQQAAQEAGLL